jgi:hypothetical protein
LTGGNQGGTCDYDEPHDLLLDHRGPHRTAGLRTAIEARIVRAVHASRRRSSARGQHLSRCQGTSRRQQLEGEIEPPPFKRRRFWLARAVLCPSLASAYGCR